MRCIVKDGEKWEKCPDHINHDGGHGEYKCKWMKQIKATKGWKVPEHNCLNPKYNILQFTDEDFLL